MSPSPAESYATDEWRLELADGRSPICKLPLSSGCYHPNETQRRHYADMVRARVDSLLVDEKLYTERRDHQLLFLDPNEWKQVETSGGLRFYRRLRRGRSLVQLAREEPFPEVQEAVEHGYTSMVCDGQVKGSMEDMMLGMTAASQEDLMTGFWFKNHPRDCVWLGTTEGPTSEDPFRSADFIWAYPKLAYHVDICYLKATGVELDDNGKRYGYLVLHSVDLTQCRPFETHKIARVHMYFTCLFREISPGYLKVTVRGIFDLGQRRGKLTKKLVTAATKSFMAGLLNGVGIGEAKKLTLMARRNRDAVRAPKLSTCSVCFKTKKMLSFRHLLQCGVCGATVCSNCVAKSKQRLFLGHTAPYSEHACCRDCVRDATVMSGVRPADPEFQVIADYIIKRFQLSPSTSRRSSSVGPQSPSPRTYPLDTVSRNRGSGRHKPPLKTNSSVDLTTNSTADESLDTNPFSRELDDADFCFSSDGEETNSSVVVEPDQSPPTSDSEGTVVVWKRRGVLDDDDFVPRSAAYEQTSSRFEALQQRLFQLNVTAEQTYLQTQNTAMMLQNGGLD